MKNKQLPLLLVAILIVAIFSMPTLLSRFVPISEDGSIMVKVDHCLTSKGFSQVNLSSMTYRNGVCEWRGVIYRTGDGYRLEFGKDRDSIEFAADDVLMVVLKRRPTE